MSAPLPAGRPAPAAAERPTERDLVRQFHAAFGVPVNVGPPSAALPDDRLRLRYRLVAEEMELECGIPGGEVFRAIHASNMAKLGPDGRPVLRADGKVTKPTGWTPPDVAEVLARHTGDGNVTPGV